MTVSDVFKTVRNTLEKAGCDSPAFDACCLLEDLAYLPRGRRLESDETILTAETVQKVLKAASRRANGEPLQYILGEWEFLTLTLSVGKGVLIPRPDTELLCEVAAEQLKNLLHPTVLDLCAGSGCVGLGLCSLLPVASVTEVELSEDAAVYLRQNLKRYPAFDAQLVTDDVLSPSKTYLPVDAILSNPPYIPTADIGGLMREVQHEPKMALDGDADGLRFYRAITNNWLPYLKQGGLLAVEIGIGQAADVKALFETAGLHHIAVYRDLGGVERVVTGRK
ncbi:MAG: peptide chain release factor N(5)-glutamine methyltransferase [Ruminococcaceae bacterium]|nr:peptide chain release factor N(5)-glutamine methyltransferase [Oscillospiraceae bacterium]